MATIPKDVNDAILALTVAIYGNTDKFSEKQWDTAISLLSLIEDVLADNAPGSALAAARFNSLYPHDVVTRPRPPRGERSGPD